MQQIQDFSDVLESELFSLIFCVQLHPTTLCQCSASVILRSLFAPIKIFRKKTLFLIHTNVPGTYKYVYVLLTYFMEY